MIIIEKFCNYGSRLLIFVGSNAFYIIHWAVDIHMGKDFFYFLNIFVITTSGGFSGGFGDPSEAYPVECWLFPVDRLCWWTHGLFCRLGRKELDFARILDISSLTSPKLFAISATSGDFLLDAKLSRTRSLWLFCTQSTVVTYEQNILSDFLYSIYGCFTYSTAFFGQVHGVATRDTVEHCTFVADGEGARLVCAFRF